MLPPPPPKTAQIGFIIAAIVAADGGLGLILFTKLTGPSGNVYQTRNIKVK